MASRTILVTGAAGFIGSHVSEFLLDRGDRVVGFDNFNDYYDPARKETNVREVAARFPGAPYEVIRGDLRDRDAVARLFRDHRFDGIAHLAAMAGVRARPNISCSRTRRTGSPSVS